MSGCRISKVTDKKTGRSLVILPTNKYKDNSTTRRLEEALQWARTGEIVAVGLFAVRSDGAVVTGYCGNVETNYIHSLAAVSELKYRLQSEVGK